MSKLEALVAPQPDEPVVSVPRLRRLHSRTARRLQPRAFVFAVSR